MAFKKFAGDAGNFLSRAVQKTEEALSSGEKTQLDPELEAMMRRGDSIRNYTKRIAKDLDSVLNPNSGGLNLLDKKKTPKMSQLECLGQGMVEAGNEFGATTDYGKTLILVGENEIQLGQSELEFITTAQDAYSEPLNRFLENEVKLVTKARTSLENKRLDLDSAKSRLKKARKAVPSKSGTDPRTQVEQAEKEVQTAQLAFDQQAEVLKGQLEIMFEAQVHQVENLKQVIAAQAAYYKRCSKVMLEFGRGLERAPPVPPIPARRTNL